MADVALSTIAGNSGAFIADFASATTEIPTSTSANVTVSCPAGKRIVLTGLATNSANQTGVTVTFGARAVLSGVTIDQEANPTLRTASRVKVGSGASANHNRIVGNIDEDLVFSFAAATTTPVYYTYETGE